MGDQVSIMWFRRDLRLADHPALTAAAEAGRVVPLFVHDPSLTRRAGANRVAYLHATLDALDASMGGALVERVGDPVEQVAALAAEVDASSVRVSADFGPAGSARDTAVAARLEADGRALRAVGSPYAVDPGTLRTKSATPFKVFTPYSKAWRAHGWNAPLPVPAHLDWRAAESHDRPPTPLPEATSGLPPVGEDAAHRAADAFLSHQVVGYRDERDRPDLDATSRLSPHLKFGTIHPRQLLDRLSDDKGPATFASELAWREFYADVLHHWPETVHANFSPGMDGLVWDTGAEADERFAAWCEGRTGYPIVDAGMRQLLAEGWMHNRVRMITASFLVKDLHIDWRRGAAWFLRHLYDGDLASNTHGWQWTAGTGTDAAPFFRVFNPTAQAQRFDPSGHYVGRYAPDLCPPIVDHAAERDEALARYQHR